MSPKPYTPDDDIEYVNDAGIRKKKEKAAIQENGLIIFFSSAFLFWNHLPRKVWKIRKLGV